MYVKFFNYTLFSWLFCSTAIFASDYSTPLVNPEWRTTSSVFECKLEHHIPNYGWVEVQQRAGEPQNLSLKTDLILQYPGKVQIYSDPAAWLVKNGASPRELLGEVSMQSGKSGVVLDQALSKQVLQVLKAGRMTTFEFGKAHQFSGPTDRVMISTAGFQKAYDDFSSCLAILLPVSLKDLQKSHVFFEENSYEVSPEGQAWLEYVVAYVKAKTEPVAMVQLEGFSDNLGTYAENRLISLKRVWAVKDYLVYHGVPSQIIRIRGMASRDPIGDNATADGRAKNRRVTIELAKDPYLSPQYRDSDD